MKLAILGVFALVATPLAAQSKPVSRAEFEAQQTRKWQRYDLNGDGKATPEELLKARPNRQDGSAYTLDSVTKSLAKRDANGDGTVTLAEAVAAEMPRFAAMDADKDGTVTPEERANEPK